MTSNTKDRIVELAIQLHDFILKYAGKDTDDYKLEIGSPEYNIIKEFDDILSELHQTIVEQKL